MACQPTKCCFCAPLRPGLLAWAYIKLVLALSAIIVVCLYYTPYDSRILLPLGVCLLYLVFTIIFIVGVHRENVKLLLIFLVYSILEVILAGAAFGYQLYLFVDMISFYRSHSAYYDNVPHRYIDNPVWYFRLILPVVVNMLLPIYLMVLIKSELKRLKIARGDTCDVLDNPVTKEQDKTYNFIYSNETADLRKPLFPVEELERLRQQSGVNNV